MNDTDPNTRPASPSVSPERIDLPGGYWMSVSPRDPQLWRVYNVEGCHIGAISGYSHARAFAAVLTSPPSTAEVDEHDGWLFHNPDTGIEWSQDHPVESGQVGDAEDIRPATLAELKDVLFSAWHKIAEMERGLPDAPSSAQPSEPVTLPYTNWRGETADREITPTGRLLFTSNEWHPTPQWLVEVFDHVKGEVRLFALSGFGKSAMDMAAVDPDVREGK